MKKNKIISTLSEIGFTYFMTIGLHGIYVKDDINVSIGNVFFNVSDCAGNSFFRCMIADIKNIGRDGRFFNVELFNSCASSIGGLK